MIPTELSPPVPAPRLLRRYPWRRALTAGVLAWLALTFLLRDPLHYLIDASEASFGRFWPHRAWLLLHIVGGVGALVLGPFQFSTRLRARHLAVHRAIGRSYLAAVALAGAPGFYLAFFATELSFGVALLTLALVWWLTTGIAFAAILRRRITTHREWMVRSYIVTFAFVTFRLLGTIPIWAPFGVHREAIAGTVAWVVPLLVYDL